MKVLILMSVLFSSISAFSFECKLVVNKVRKPSLNYSSGDLDDEISYELYNNEGKQIKAKLWQKFKKKTDCVRYAIECEKVVLVEPTVTREYIPHTRSWKITTDDPGKWEYVIRSKFNTGSKEERQLEAYDHGFNGAYDEGFTKITSCKKAKKIYVRENAYTKH